MKHAFLICTLASFLAEAQTQGLAPLQNLNIGAALDLVAPLSLDNDSKNRLSVRSAELLIYAPIDHLFDGLLNIAGHSDEGQFQFELHEGYIGSSKLIPQSRFKIGKFLLGVGRLNSFHQHDWPFVSAPKVQREFLQPGPAGEARGVSEAESAADTGVEYTWLLPTKHFLDITVGVTGNYCFGHCHNETGRPPRPLYYIRPTTFFSWGSGHGLLLGVSHLSRKSSSYEETNLYGVDVTYKKREGKRLKWLLQSEAFYQEQAQPGSSRSQKAGIYVYPQYGLDERWQLGLRLDAFSHLNMRFAITDEKRRDLDYAFVPTLTYRPSEFSLLRVAYAHEVDTTQGQGDVLDRQFQFQLVYFIGAHPPHEF